MDEIELASAAGDAPVRASLGLHEDGCRFVLTLATESIDGVAVPMSRTQVRALVSMLVEATAPERGEGDPALTADDFRALLLLLRRYANTELDQFDHCLPAFAL